MKENMRLATLARELMALESQTFEVVDFAGEGDNLLMASTSTSSTSSTTSTTSCTA